MSIDDLITAAVVKHKFRRQRMDEANAAYLDELIKHVDRYDWAEAHELRVGRVQNEWTRADVDLFITYSLAAVKRPRPSRPVPPFVVAIDPGPYEVSDAKLTKLATDGLTALCERRAAQPDSELPIFLTVMLTSGSLMHTSVSSGDRHAVLRALAREHPVFGYWILYDAFTHGADVISGKMSKGEAIIANIGSRTLALIRKRPYRRVGGKIAFNPPGPDVDRSASLHDAFDDVFGQRSGKVH